MIEATREDARKLSEELQSDAASKAEKLIKRAESELQAEREKLYRELRLELASLVVTATAKILETDTTPAERKHHAEQIVKELSK